MMVMFSTKRTQKCLTKPWIMLCFSTSSVTFAMPDPDGLTHVWTVRWPEQCQVDRLKEKNREEKETSNWKFQKPTVRLVSLKLEVSGETPQKGLCCWLHPHDQVNWSKRSVSVDWSSRCVWGEQTDRERAQKVCEGPAVDPSCSH